MASQALGFKENEYLQARADHVDRATRIAEAQAAVAMKAKLAEAEMGLTKDDSKGGDLKRPAARGIKDLDPDRKSGLEERREATDTTLSADKRKPVRGKGKSLNKASE